MNPPFDLALLTAVLDEEPRFAESILRTGVPRRGGVFRFREDDKGYNESFALQWNRFRTNQIDAANGAELSVRRFSETDWKIDDLSGRTVLEAGCGAGRLARIFAGAGGAADQLRLLIGGRCLRRE